MSHAAMLRADAARYRGPGPIKFVINRGLWAMAVFRLGQWMLALPMGPRRATLLRGYSLLVVATQVMTRIEIWPNTAVGPGLWVSNHGHIVVNAATRIGAGCSLGRGVTLGVSRAGDERCPTLHDGVELGDYAQVFGALTLGAGARVATMSVVVIDVPIAGRAAGLPARLL